MEGTRSSSTGGPPVVAMVVKAEAFGLLRIAISTPWLITATRVLSVLNVAKMVEAPILHVNGEEPMELYWASLFALEFRQKFGRDIVLDMYCYRRQGHNEADQAAFTQPDRKSVV